MVDAKYAHSARRRTGEGKSSMRSAIILLVPLVALLAACGDGNGLDPSPSPSLAPTEGVTVPHSPSASPRPEPGAQRIAYIGTDMDVWIIDENGSGNQKLFDLPTESGDTVQNLQWAPDGTKFAVTRSPKDVVYIINAGGDQLLEVPAVSFLAWSPSSDTFIVMRPPALEVEAAILRVNLAGEIVTEVPTTDPPNTSFHASLSPDGRRLAFLRDIGGDGLCGAIQGFLVDFETRDTQPADPAEEPVSCGNGPPIFSPTDPSLVAYGNGLLDPLGNRRASLPGNAVRWSQDGRLLVLCVPASGGHGQLYRVDSRSTALEFDYTPAPDGPCWMHLMGWNAISPDGGLLAVHERSTGTARILGVATGSEHEVSVLPGGAQSLQFSPDGRYLLVMQLSKASVVDTTRAAVVSPGRRSSGSC